MKMKNMKKVMMSFVVAMVLMVVMSIDSQAAGALGLKQTDSGETSIHVEWTKELGNTYKVEICEKSDFTGTVVTDGKFNDDYEYAFYELNPATIYYVRVTSKSGKVDTIQVTTGTKGFDYGAEAKQIAATPTTGTIQWPKVEGADGYRIYLDNKLVTDVKGGNTTTGVVKQGIGKSCTYSIVPYKKAPLTGYVAEAPRSSVRNLIETVWTTPIAPSKVGVASNSYWNPKSNNLHIGWEDSKQNECGVRGHQIEIKTIDGKKKVKTYYEESYGYLSSSTSVKINKIKNTGCQVRVRAYIKLNDKKFFGPWTQPKVMVPLRDITDKEVSATATKISWKKVANATKYEIYVAKNQVSSNNEKAKFKKVATVKGNKKLNYTINGLKDGKYTYVYVVPTVKVGKKTYKAMKVKGEFVKFYK